MSHANGKTAFERTEARPLALEVRSESIPAELRERPQWVCWRYEQVVRGGAKRWTKIPVEAMTGRNASSTNPQSWSTFDEALGYYQAHRSRLDGVGFVFAADDPFAGVDLDDALDADTGNVRSWAKPILANLASYSEASPSRTGVKVFLRGQLPEDCKHRKPYGDGEVEVYDRGRFFVLTGHRLADYPAGVEDRRTQLDALYRRVFVEEAESSRAKPNASPLPDMDDNALLEKAMRAANGDKFRRLWGGDLSDHDGDDSRADMALCLMLAFWTGGDAARIDRLFRRSGLMREKWDERRGAQTYGQLTIAQALARSTQHYGEGKPGSNGTAMNTAATAQREEPSYQFHPITSAEFAGGDFRPTWLVKRLLVARQPAIIGAPKKSLKTTLAVDLALSLATATPFLGSFDVYKPLRVAVVSGESGEHTLQETARRICAAKGISFPDANVLWAFDLPQLANAVHVAELCDGIETHEIDVLIIDPLYLCLLAGDVAKNLDAANLYHTGPLFRSLSKAVLGCACTPILIHHSVKHLPNPGEPMELESLAYAGIAEFARQWLLLNRREPYDPDATGSHKLWLGVGGSAGQSGLWALDVEEGELGEDFAGRKWEVSIQTATAVRTEKAEEANTERTEKQHRQTHADATAVLTQLDKLAGKSKEYVGYTKVREAAGISNARMTRAVLSLIGEGIVEEGEANVWRGKGKKVKATVKGLRRKPREEATD